MSSPETKKKRQALPSVLSNIRNAQAAIGRATTTAADEPHHEWEMREREGNVISSPLMQPPVDRRNQTTSSSYSSSSYATTLNNFSQRFGNEWRTQKRRLRRKDSSGVPSSFYFAVGCFFFAFPIIFILYILARHSVFGDEGYGSGTVVQKQQHVDLSSTIVVNPDDEIKGKNFGVNDGKDLDLHVREEDGSVDPTSYDGVVHSYGDMAGQKESHHDSFIPSEKNDITTNDDHDVEEAEKSLPPSSDKKEATVDKSKKSSEGELLRGSHPKSTVKQHQTFSAEILKDEGDRRRILRDFAVAVAAVAV